MKNLPYLLALHSVDGLGPVRLKLLLEYFKDPKIVWEASTSELKQLSIPPTVIERLKQTKKSLNPESYFEEINKIGIKILTLFDETYPRNLSEIYDPPIVLFYKGEITLEDEKALGVVGTRKITGYGKTVTEEITQELAEAGLTIVSGLARGVDCVAHQAALKAKGRTLAILGGGLNKIFPPENIGLAQRIWEGYGAVISEFPPDYPSLSGNFPARNRIIAGLSLGVVVTEAAEDSGSLITAKEALEQGREVFAVPGPITSSLSSGTATLIKNGAKLITSAQDVLDDLGLKMGSKISQTISFVLTPIQKQILECLKDEGEHIDEICRKLHQKSSEIGANLIQMEILGLVKNLGGGNYIAS